jgi:hypothetical protein
MATISDIKITLDLRNPQLDDEAWEKLTQSLRREIIDNAKNIKNFLGFLSDCLSGKAITIKVEANPKNQPNNL